jgi:hypothetical protein
MSVAKTRLIGLAGDMSGLTIIQCATVPRLAASNAVERNSFGAGDEASDTSLLTLELRGILHAAVVLREEIPCHEDARLGVLS